MEKTCRIGVFDSGIGGLSVLRACQRAVPHARYYYYGDNNFAPYGSRTKGEIERRVRSALKLFERLGVEIAVLACNTATTLCIEEMRREFSFPIVGVEPAVLPAARVCRRALVLATPRTVGSERLRFLLSQTEHCEFTLFAPPRLVTAIEDHVLLGKQIRLEEHLPVGSFDGVVLGCTHYVHVSEAVSSFYRAPVFDGGEGAARLVSRLVKERENCQLFGNDDHFCDESHGALIFTNCQSDRTYNDIIFLGKTKNLNEFAYKRLFISKS